MSLRRNIQEQEAEALLNRSHNFVSDLIKTWKGMLRSNKLTFSGKVLDLSYDVDGPQIVYTEEFENWVFKNVVLLKDKVQLVLLLNEADDEEKKMPERPKRRRPKPTKGEGSD